MAFHLHLDHNCPELGCPANVNKHPTEHGGEDDEDGHANQHDKQRAFRAVHDDFIDDGLGEQRRG